MNQFLVLAIKNWKSTAQGFLSVAIAMGVYCSITPTTMINQKAAGIITFVTGGLKILLAMIQKD